MRHKHSWRKTSSALTIVKFTCCMCDSKLTISRLTLAYIMRGQFTTEGIHQWSPNTEESRLISR